MAFEPDDFIKWMVGDGYSRKTCVTYSRSVVNAQAWLGRRGLDLATVDGLTLRDYAESLPWSRSSRAALRSAVAAYWRFVERFDGPASAVRVPKQRRMRCKALEEDAAAILVDAARARKDRKGLAVLLGLYAGLRVNEVATLRWSDIEAGWVTLIGKQDRQRSLPLHPHLAEALTSHDQTAEWVFPGRFGGPQNPTTVWGWVREVSTAAGLPPIPTHVLRHTALATALDATGDLRTVQELAGHASPETTAGYTRVSKRKLEQIVNAIDYRGATQ